MQAMHVHGCDEYIEKPCPPETILEIVQRLVPPGTAAKAVAVARGGGAPVSAHPGKRGEVIPSPRVARATRPPTMMRTRSGRSCRYSTTSSRTLRCSRSAASRDRPLDGVEEPGVLELEGEPDDLLPVAALARRRDPIRTREGVP